MFNEIWKITNQLNKCFVLVDRVNSFRPNIDDKSRRTTFRQKIKRYNIHVWKQKDQLEFNVMWPSFLICQWILKHIDIGAIHERLTDEGEFSGRWKNTANILEIIRPSSLVNELKCFKRPYHPLSAPNQCFITEVFSNHWLHLIFVFDFGSNSGSIIASQTA